VYYTVSIVTSLFPAQHKLAGTLVAIKLFYGDYMSSYQMFQQWWSKATSGPSDFRIDKRSAEIGFESALKLAEEKFNSAPAANQQLKAEILPIAAQALVHCTNYNRELAIELLNKLTAKLSAV